MQIYHYDRNTGEYTGAGAAPIDPMATKRERKEIYLIPACATTVEPIPAKEGFRRVFDGTWQYVEIPLPPEPTLEEIAAEEALEAKIAARAQAILDNLPSWQQVSNEIDAAFTNVAQRAVINKLARVIYWMAKDRAE